jgi:hypothetical protein
VVACLGYGAGEENLEEDGHNVRYESMGREEGGWTRHDVRHNVRYESMGREGGGREGCTEEERECFILHRYRHCQEEEEGDV